MFDLTILGVFCDLFENLRILSAYIDELPQAMEYVFYALYKKDL